MKKKLTKLKQKKKNQKDKTIEKHRKRWDIRFSSIKRIDGMDDEFR